MLLCIKQRGRRINELRFSKGPIYFGRQMGSQVFLPETGVSRQHAVIYTDEKGHWVIEDLDSANKTFVNRNAVHKCVLQDGDSIDISEFTVEFTISEESKGKKPAPSIHLDDTVTNFNMDIHAEIRLPDAKNAPLMKIPAKRIRDLHRATYLINQSATIEDIQKNLVDILISQFAPHSVWVALRKFYNTEMDVEGGRKRNREFVKKDELFVHQYIEKAVEKQKYILIPQLPRNVADGSLRSVIIAPVLANRKCYGMLYCNNSKEHEHYEMDDLDYLMIIATVAAAAIETM